MKKSILLLVAIFSIAVVFTSCKETKKEEVKTESREEIKTETNEDKEIHEHEEGEMSSGDVYQCPMDCEKGKTYDKPGSCPVCKMDLKKVSKDSDKQAMNCTCKDGGECTCAPGECKCDDKKTAKMEKECTKCEPGKCVCKA
jgi:hypothetical protein